MNSVESLFRFASVSKQNMDIFSFGQVINRLDRCGLFICYRGEVVLMVNGENITLRRGGIYLYMPSVMMRPISATDDAEGMIASIDVNYVVQGINRVSSIDSILFLRNNPYVQMSEEQFQKSTLILDVVRQKLDDTKNIGYTGIKHKLQLEVLKSIGQVALFEILSIFFENKKDNDPIHSKKDLIFFNFITSLYRNYKVQRDVSFYAEEQHLSPRYFSAIVKEKSGSSALQWIVNVVIGEMKQMLETSDMSIKDIAQIMGFPTQSFFGKYFKQYVGMSPKDYRIEMQKMGLAYRDGQK